MESNFTYGDLLIGNKESSQEYSETIEGTKWVFIGLWADELGGDEIDEDEQDNMLVLSLEDWESINATNLFYPFTEKMVTQWEYVVEPQYFYSPGSALQLSNQHLAKHVLEKYDS